MVAQFIDAQPDRDGETRADHRDCNGPGSDRPGIGTGLSAPTTPPPNRCRRAGRHGKRTDRTTDLPEDSGGRHRPTGERRRDQP
jgi:hypothetical protein